MIHIPTHPFINENTETFHGIFPSIRNATLIRRSAYEISTIQ